MMEHFGWNVGTFVTIGELINAIVYIAIIDEPRGPSGRSVAIGQVVWAGMCLLAFIGVLPW